MFKAFFRIRNVPISKDRVLNDSICIATRRNFNSTAGGAGPSGYVASIKAAQLGLKVACVEGRETLGGTCLNVGCIPSKSLLHNSHLYYLAKNEFQKRGIDISGLSINLPQMLKAKEASVSTLTSGISGLFRKNKVNWIKGWGKITSNDTVEIVDPKSGENKSYKTKNIIIATGSVPTSFPGIEIDGKSVVSSTGALSLQKIPEKLLVLGGGIIGLELGSVWSRLGSNVTVVEYLDSIGGQNIDSTIAKSLSSILKKQGINIKTGTKAVNFSKTEDGKITMYTETVSGGKMAEETGDVLLISVGRKPYSQNLGLEDVGIKTDSKGTITVDDNFVTSVPSIRAIGDVIRGPMLAHKAEEEGIAVIESIVNGYVDVNYAAIPSVVYTWPEVAWVGKTEKEVADSKIDYKVGTFPFIANSRARTVDESEGLVKVISQKSDDKILGIHIIGANASEIIGEAVLAIGYGASSEDIARTCHAHPTFSEALKEACMAVHSKAIHF